MSGRTQSATQRAIGGPRRRVRRAQGGLLLCGLGVLVLAVLVWEAVVHAGTVPDPTDPHVRLGHGAVVLDSGLLVFREGLEAILILAAVTASFVGGNRSLRRPVGGGAAAALGASVVTWFLAVWVIGSLGGAGDSPQSLDVQAATGLLAVAVLIVVMNWFFHRVYWTGWISHHNERRRSLLAGNGNLSLGLALLGFTVVYREGFEIVLFLQNLRLQRGTGAVVEGVVVGLALTAVVGALTFALHHRLPYRKMLVLTGVFLGGVLLVMVGESIQEMQLAGWLSTTGVGFHLPDWAGLWFATFANAQGLAAQLAAALVVAGSYFLADYIRFRRPAGRGEMPARRPDAPPASPTDVEALVS